MIDTTCVQNIKVDWQQTADIFLSEYRLKYGLKYGYARSTYSHFSQLSFLCMNIENFGHTSVQ